MAVDGQITTKYQGEYSKVPFSPVLRPLEGKAAAAWTSRAYEQVHDRARREECHACAPEGGQGVRTPPACLPKLRRRRGGIFQHSQKDNGGWRNAPIGCLPPTKAILSNGQATIKYIRILQNELKVPDPFYPI